MQKPESRGLILFDTIVDTDYGMINMIREEYNNPQFIDVDFLNAVSEHALIAELYERQTENPLTLVLKDDYIGQADSLYNQFIESKYDKILDMSRNTNLIGYYRILRKQGQMTLTILCKNVQEQHFIEKLKMDIQTIVEPDYSKIPLKDYDFLYLKKYSDIEKFKDIRKLNIYVCKYSFNTEKDNITPKLLFSDKISDKNQIFTIEPYNINKDIVG